MSVHEEQEVSVLHVCWPIFMESTIMYLVIAYISKLFVGCSIQWLKRDVPKGVCGLSTFGI